MKSLKLALLWVGVVFLFASYGFIDAYDEVRHLQFSSFTLETVIGCGSIGIGVATCGVIGLVIGSGVRSGWLGKPSAGFLLLVSFALSTTLPTIAIIGPIQSATRARESSDGTRMFQGERSWSLVMVPLLTLYIAAPVSTILVVYVLTAKKARAMQAAHPSTSQQSVH